MIATEDPIDVIPIKLRDDAIVEAVCQVHFSTAVELPEVVLGRLSDFGDKGEFRVTRLPAADIPAVVRRNDPNFRHQALLELKNEAGSTVRVGDNVISIHVVGVGKYPGWETYRPQVQRMLTQLFFRVSEVEIHNATLRYINALVPTRHHIASIHDLEIRVAVGDAQFKGRMNLNISEPRGDEFVVTTRIADTTFVQGNLPDGTVAVVDIEVSSPAGYRSRDALAVGEWFVTAHDLEKDAFFRLFPAAVLPVIVER